MLHVSMIGCGAIGVGVMELLKSDPEVVFDLVIVPQSGLEHAGATVRELCPHTRVDVGLNGSRPDLLIECAGHLAIEEHIIPALESSHALAEAIKRAPNLPKDHLMVICLSGRGDKDMQTVMNHMAAQEKQA